MAAPAGPITAWGQYLGARVAEAALSAFPAESNLRAAGGLGRLLYRLDRRHRLRTLEHLRIAFPELCPAALEDLGRRAFEHFTRLVVEVTASPRRLTPSTWPQRIQARALGPALEILNAGRPALLLTGHLGNWEVLGTFLGLLGYDLQAIARPIDNPLINRWLLSIRQRRGLRIITKWNATDTMLAVLSGGGALGFIADQNAGRRGLFVPFFGRLASTYKSIGLLAIRQEVPIICGYAHRLGEGLNFELGVDDVIHPQDWAGRRDPLYYVTARYMRSIENMIRRRPEQYLWMHRRWKSRPRHEELGKPMPAALQRNLEELPWMDPATLDRLRQPPAPISRT